MLLLPAVGWGSVAAVMEPLRSENRVVATAAPKQDRQPVQLTCAVAVPCSLCWRAGELAQLPTESTAVASEPTVLLQLQGTVVHAVVLVAPEFDYGLLWWRYDVAAETAMNQLLNQGELWGLPSRSGSSPIAMC